MSKWDHDDEWEDETDAEDFADDDASETRPCPYCRAEIYEDAEYCPRCEQYLSREEGKSTGGKRWWVTATAIVLLLFFLWMVFRGLM